MAQGGGDQHGGAARQLAPVRDREGGAAEKVDEAHVIIVLSIIRIVFSAEIGDNVYTYKEKIVDIKHHYNYESLAEPIDLQTNIICLALYSFLQLYFSKFAVNSAVFAIAGKKSLRKD